MKNELSHISSSKFIEGKSILPFKKSFTNDPSKKITTEPSKINSKIDYINEKSLNNNEKNDINEFSDNSTNIIINESKKIEFPFYYYLIPFWFLELSKKNDIFYCYDNIFKKFLSIEVMIPLLERISLFTDMKKNDKYVFKVDTFLSKNE